jgi:cysteine desulfurase
MVMSSERIYLDNHSTTRVDPRVVAAMLPYFGEQYGNAGSTSHDFGWEARDAVEAARASLAAAIGAASAEIVFTSGATESNNLALRGVAERPRRRGDHIVSVVTEHKAMLDPLARLARRGFETTLLPVVQVPNPQAGLLDVNRVAEALRDDTCLVSVMLANNEIGVLQPLAEIAKLCGERGVWLHTDATQAVGKIPVNVAELGVDLLSFSAHKLYGPKGVGALYVRRGSSPVRLEPQIDGGGQEHGFRSGTLNVPGIVGFAQALALCLEEMEAETARLRALRERLFAGLQRELPDVLLNGPAIEDPRLRLANNLNCTFPQVDGEALLLNMKTIAVSSGSACTSANPEPSHVLRALGRTLDDARASLRFGLGRFNTAEHIDTAIATVSQAVRELRGLIKD